MSFRVLIVLVKGDDGGLCRDLVKEGKDWVQAKAVCDRALSPQNRGKYDDSDRYHLLIARAKTQLSSDAAVLDASGALRDLDEAVGLKPALTGPYLQRAEAQLLLGHFGAALKDLERFDESPRISELRRRIQRGEQELRMAREAKASGSWRSVAERAAGVLKNAAPQLKEAQELLRMGVLGMKEWPRALRLVSELPAADPVLVATIQMASGDLNGAQKTLAAAGDSPEEARELKEFVDFVAGRLEEAEHRMLLRPAIAALEALETEASERWAKAKGLHGNGSDVLSGVHLKIDGLLCLKYAKMKQSEKAIAKCKAVLGRDKTGLVDYTLSLSEAYRHLEQLDESVRVLEEAMQAKPNDHRLKEAFQEAQKARKAAANPDYYALLGVSRDASATEIKKAYRKLATKYHPDKMKTATPEAKRAAELKMGQINRAYTVLGDKEQRAQYDRGFDPEDPMAGAAGHGNPFGGGGGGGFPFGGHPGGAHFNFGSGGGGGGHGGQFHFGGAGGVPFEFIFQAMNQQQQQQQQRHKQRKQKDQAYFNFRDEL
jgi:DnaJ family protein C protein 3